MRRTAGRTTSVAAVCGAVVFAPTRARAQTAPPNEQDEDYTQVVQVRATSWSSPRGLADVRVKRDALDAAPHQQTSEMLSAAPGFFVDHEDAEGFGNDVYLRGFDVDHGSGIEMRVANVPINIPLHIQGQGYADANFIIPEVVRSIRVLEGPYDPRQGDAAIVGSAYFDLGVPERGYQLKATGGSFGQLRLVGVAAPRGMDDESFAAVSVRRTSGFGQDRESQSASFNGQYAIDLGTRDRLRFLATGYGAEADLPGVVRQDDVDAGRIGYYDAYPYLAQNQGVRSSRILGSVDYDHTFEGGAHFEAVPWVTWTDFRARQNFTGAVVGSLGDLFQTTNTETAAGVTSRVHAAPIALGDSVQIAFEPGIQVRYGHTDQSKSLLVPSTLQTWDRRADATLDSLDAGGYLDVDLRLWKRLRISGGPRVDLLGVGIDDHLAGSSRAVSGVAFGPRVTAEVDVARQITPVVSYGEGFRSIDADALQPGSTPYSKVRSVEAGFRAQTPGDAYVTSLAVFSTWVANELVFDATSGGLETEAASVRRGIVSSFAARPVPWLLASTAVTVTEATFTDPGEGHWVPSIPPVLFRVDATVHGPIATLHGKAVQGRIGAGYTYLAGRFLTDLVVGPANNVLNARAAARYDWLEIGVDAYNLLNLRYPDDADYYVSNWSVKPGPQPASAATHISAAPPLTVLGTVAAYF
ncbi:MAG TPA: TonB-dependent receptor plug domain-containing protein [Polyangiaceae bacterium]